MIPVMLVSYGRAMRSALIACALVACNQVWGLDSTNAQEPGPDRDGDTVSDEFDNCVDIPNATQTDDDDDGFGNACDDCPDCAPCDHGPQHDEDGDSFADDCDNCPTVKNNQANADGDDLGDDCDASATLQRRKLFDGFGTIDSTWARLGPWDAVGDAAATVEGPHPLGYRLTRVEPIITGQSTWTMEIVFDVPAAPEHADSLGGYLVNQGGDAVWACTLYYDTSMWTLTHGIPDPITVAPGETKMILSSQRNGTTDRYCTVAGKEKSNLAFGETYPLGVELWTNRPSRFLYIEVIE